MSSNDRIASWEVVPVRGEASLEALSASPAGPLVARIVRAGGGEAIELFQRSGTVTLGRSRTLPLECRVEVERVSGKHCSLRVDANTGRVTLIDLSTNGTFLNDERIPPGDAGAVELQCNDRIALFSPLSAENPAEMSAAEFVFQVVPATTAPVVGDMAEGFTCTACHSIFVRPCRVLPCKHTFCASCISRWLDLGKYNCMQCTTGIVEVRPDDSMRNALDQFLLENPTLRPSPIDIAESAAIDAIHDDVLRVRRRHRESREVEGCSEGIGEESSRFPPSEFAVAGRYVSREHGRPRLEDCRHCEAPSRVDGFRCDYDTPHQTCMDCHEPFPQRSLSSQPQNCQLCRAPHCALYYEAEGGCAKGRGIVRMSDYSPTDDILKITFEGNGVEQEILKRYLAGKGISVQALWEECYAQFKSGNWVPDVPRCNVDIDPDTPLCAECITSIFASLIFLYRLKVPRDQLPEDVTERPNCSNGKECSTHLHTTQHVKQYNHACYQEKRKE